MKEKCPECGAVVEPSPLPKHPYIPASEGCWAAFGELQAYEMNHFGYPNIHRLIVDAYMASHPGNGNDRRLRQSTFLHLVGLCASLEIGMHSKAVAHLFRTILNKKDDIPRLQPIDTQRSELTFTSLFHCETLPDYEQRAKRWANRVWESWEHEHGRIKTWVTKIS